MYCSYFLFPSFFLLSHVFNLSPQYLFAHLIQATLSAPMLPCSFSSNLLFFFISTILLIFLSHLPHNSAPPTGWNHDTANDFNNLWNQRWHIRSLFISACEEKQVICPLLPQLGDTITRCIYCSLRNMT